MESGYTQWDFPEEVSWLSPGIRGLNHDTVESGCKYNRRYVLRQNSCAKRVVDSRFPRVRVWVVKLPSMVKTESELYLRTRVSMFHTHTFSVSAVDSRSLWGVYPWVLSDTPTECVTLVCQHPNPIPETKHQTPHKPCTKQDVHATKYTVRGIFSLKTSSFLWSHWVKVRSIYILAILFAWHKVNRGMS